jgi:hypothetical protein
MNWLLNKPSSPTPRSPKPSDADEGGDDDSEALGFCPLPITGPVIVNKGNPYKTFIMPDFLEFRKLADGMDVWTLRYAKGNVFAWDQPPPPRTCKFKLVKVFAVFDDIPGEVMYDVLHDPNYRKEWDDAMIQGYNICQLDATNDVGYYAVKTPSPSSNRDFCNQRAWIATTSGEYIILNTSVEHPDQPPVKGFVRAFSFISGYFLRPHGDGTGCTMTYVTQSNPRGWVPSSLMNSLTAKFAPNLMEKLRVAARKYPAWKAKNELDHKPWRTPPVEWVGEGSDHHLTPMWVASNMSNANPASPTPASPTPASPARFPNEDERTDGSPKGPAT